MKTNLLKNAIKDWSKTQNNNLDKESNPLSNLLHQIQVQLMQEPRNVILWMQKIEILDSTGPLEQDDPMRKKYEIF